MRCLVFAFALVIAGCSSYSQLGSGGSGGSRGSGTSDGSETTVVWLDSQGAFPSVGYFDVQTIFNVSELGPGSYIRVAAIHITGTAREALVNKLRLSASQIGANRLLIVKVEETKEEVSLYSELENVARFFSGEKTDADRSNEAYTLRIDAIAIRQSDDLTNVLVPRQGEVWPTVYRPRSYYDRPTVYRPRRPRRSYDRPTVYRPPRRDYRPTAKPPRRDDRRPVNPSLPKNEPPIAAPPPPKNERPPDRTPSPPPPPKDEPPAVKPPPPPPEEDRSSRKQPRMKTHRP
ncbi:MAG: hypothetical protein F4X08_11900 [Gemmatimonadetes bacterium]|nr:hypothetical protein [Gemmatimonadota bacterium]MYD26506.1 hypothetical protein [Gemmatimonadota bacterium]MYI98987.1 hypothetical protein [Gemmatimonadota bacterium]